MSQFELQQPSVYENHEWSQAQVTNYNVKTGQSAFTVSPSFKRCVIRTDATITVRFNSVTADAITIAANTSFDCDFLTVENIFLTTSGASNVKILLA